MSSLISRIGVDFAATLDNAVDLGASRSTLRKQRAVSLANGVGAGQADRVWADTLTVAPSASQDIDLAGALVDALGGACVFARIKGLAVFADPGNTNNVDVGGAASNPWVGLLGATHKVSVRPGGMFAVAAGIADATGYVVTAGTGDILRVTNAGGTTPVTLDVVLIGASS